MNIILVHGLLGFRKLFNLVDYFRDLPKHFQAKGFTVLVPELDPTASIKDRGDQLCDQINDGFNKGRLDPTQETHIIAHSMGGLDSRYVLSPDSGKRLVASIRSVTTISTPHQGSPIADLIENPEDLLPFSKLPFRPFENKNPLELALKELGVCLKDFKGLQDLTTTACKNFSTKYKDNDSVRYFSVAGSGNPGFLPTASALLVFHHYIFAKTGIANDGLVTVDSAKWGKFYPTWPADHAEEVGYDLDNVFQPPAFPYLANYDLIVERVTSPNPG